MKITFIRHSKVLFSWKKFYNASSFELACKEYDSSAVQIGKKMKIESQPIYVSRLIRTEATAKNLFHQEIELTKTDLLNEIPLEPFINTKLAIPTIIWMAVGRLQWYFNNSRQSETRKYSEDRINKFLNHILAKKQDCIIIGHGFYFIQLVNQMKKRALRGDMKKRLGNEELRIFVTTD